jgi:hypothetical protein
MTNDMMCYCKNIFSNILRPHFTFYNIIQFSYLEIILASELQNWGSQNFSFVAQ